MGGGQFLPPPTVPVNSKPPPFLGLIYIILKIGLPTQDMANDLYKNILGQFEKTNFWRILIDTVVQKLKS